MTSITSVEFAPHAVAVAVTGAPDAWSELVGELSKIQPAHQSRSSRVADFIFRRDTTALTAGALQTAGRAHTSRLFRQALSRRKGAGQDARRAEAMADLLDVVRPGNGSVTDVFSRTKAFAAHRQEDIASLLHEGGDAFRLALGEELVKHEMGASRANKRADTIYTALVAQFVTGNEAARLQHYDNELNSLLGRAKTPAGQLALLNELQDELKADTGMSNGCKSRVAGKLAEMRGLLEQGAEMHEKLIAIATKGITFDTPASELDNRLRELDERLASINGSANLGEEASTRLRASVEKARALVMTLKARPQELDALASQPRLQAALSGLGPAEYVKARQGLTHASENVASVWRGALLDRLGSFITDPRDAAWLADIREGNPEIIDMVLPGAEWDEQALNLKTCVLNTSTGTAFVNVQVQHERRVAARELDFAMQSATFKSSMSKLPGKAKAEQAKLPANAFQALKADATLIGWFVEHAPNTLGQRDLAIANWIRLSLHDNATGQPDTTKQGELFAQLRARGLDTQQIELHAAQGFRSSADVQACANQIRSFSQALKNSSAVGALNSEAPAAAQGGMQFLGSLSKRVRAGLKKPATGAEALKIQQRQEANEATLRTVLAQLTPNQSIVIGFGVTGEVSVSTPVAPGVNVGADMSVERHKSIRVSRALDASFNVELLTGTSTRDGSSLTTFMDALNVRVGVSHERDKGHLISFDSQSGCEALLVAVANDGDVAAALQGARSVETAVYKGRGVEASVTANADFTIATLSATVAANAGETRSLHESGAIKREVFSRNVRAEAVLRAALIGDLASAQAGVGVDLGVRRAIVRENEMLAGGPPGSRHADQSPTLSMVARVTHDNLPRCLNTLLPDASVQQRQSIEAQLGELPEGTELFTRYRLTEDARAKSNVLLGRAISALHAPKVAQTEAFVADAMALVRQADAVTRDAANYTPEGFGWTVRTSSEVEKSRGIYKQFARREGEHTFFVPLEAPTAGQAAVGRSLLLSVMA